MLVIHKFGPYQPGDSFAIACRRVVHFDHQGNGELFVWGEVRTLLANPIQNFMIVGTGHSFDAHYEHRFTCITKGGFVWHLVKDVSAVQT